MALNLDVEWLRPMPLRDGRAQRLIYSLDLEAVPKRAGVYIFARTFGKAIIPIYIGQSENFRGRIKTHLFGNVPLMRGIEDQPNGRRMLLFAALRTKRGQQLDKCLDLLERTLIRFALAEGHELLNDQGTKTATHSLKFSGKKEWHRPFPRRMSVLVK
jgi:hypothetical protein